MSITRHPIRRGNVVVFVAVILAVLMAMVAFAIDIGYILHARTELQRTADACALAAATELPDESQARQAALRQAELNRATGAAEASTWGDVSDIQFGYWDRDAASFTTPAPYGKNANAVRVELEKSEAKGNPLRLFFAHLLGTEQADVAASATAMYDNNLCGPFVGIDWISVPGTPLTDSFDSEEGSYSWSTAGDRGSICSDGPINVDGNATIRGDARAGAGTTGVTITGAAEVTGSIGTRLEKLNLPPVDASQAAASNDNSQIPPIPEGNSWRSPVDANGNLLLDGNKTLDLPPGTYYLNDLTLTGQSVLNLSGPTIVYLTGDLYRAGGTQVNFNTGLAANLQIFMTGGEALVTSNNDFYGLIYGPNTNITIDGSADFFGAVVGKTLTLTGSGTGHYDESLNSTEVDFPRRTVLVD
jgi:Flp pilus assembly protein TadG/cytoskeletal protein CcmA (bactofilin family)